MTEQIEQKRILIQQRLLAGSPYVSEVNFKSIHPVDLQFLFLVYDEQFFDGLLRAAVARTPLELLLSPRLTKAGGLTKKFKSSNGDVRFSIAIASSMLFDSFRESERSVTVCGLECKNRLEALQRIFEHELIHLAEFLCWGESNCSASRFQEIALRRFGHRAHTHALVTRREIAAEAGIRVGTLVIFTFEGVQHTGRVNRITKRASVLVKDPNGQLFSDGSRYRVYYVPLSLLKRADALSKADA
jgi:hypothetical protein